MIAGRATRLGIPVMKPLNEHTRYDLIFDLQPRLLRVQCKWAPLKSDVIVVRLRTSRRTSAGRQVTTQHSAEEVDAIGVYCEALDQCFVVPIAKAAHMDAIHLRVGPTKNGQRACLNWAAEYELAGAVAQLEVASRWQREGRGFESHQLHSPDSDRSTVIGAHEFRNRFGWYMERSAAGESFLITRRGKPYARLSPPPPALVRGPSGDARGGRPHLRVPGSTRPGRT